MKNNIAFIKLEPGAADAIKKFMELHQIEKPIRINLAFKGCCDPSLEMRVGEPAEKDLQLGLDGLCFLMPSNVFDLAGEVTISSIETQGENQFILKSAKPLSEWEGFGSCEIQT